jgi:hypothetical protein
MATYNPAPIPESDSSPRAQLDPANPTSQQNNNFGADANPAGQVQEQHTSAQGGSFQTGQDTFAAKGQHEQTGTDAAPPSTVADYDYPNVPESHETQQGELSALLRAQTDLSGVGTLCWRTGELESGAVQGAGG